MDIESEDGKLVEREIIGGVGLDTDSQGFIIVIKILYNYDQLYYPLLFLDF